MNDSKANRIHMINCKSNSLPGILAVICLVQLGSAGSAFAADCNNNGVEDATDIAAGTSFDCDTNGVPDGCQIQPDFSGQLVISTETNEPQSVFAADLDGDGDLDVLSASFFDDKIAWYENTDASGTFGPQQIISTSMFFASSVYAADFDGDGDLDVISASWSDSKIAWHENTDGSGVFGPPQIITTAADQPRSVIAADIDGDGDADVLSASNNDDSIAWYENVDGQGNFGAQQVITTAADYARSVFAADMDGDGDLDVLSASENDDKIAWYENTDGLGSFGLQQVITTAADGARSVFAFDLDGDGDTDVLSASFNDTKIAWYENTNGLGNFGPQRVIGPHADSAQSVFAGDLDGDGDGDVLSSSSLDGKLAWHENVDGLGNFGHMQVIHTGLAGASSVFAADLSGNGNLDFIAANRLRDKITWHENIGVPEIPNDCNDNGTPDACELVHATSTDCNDSGIPDDCELVEGDCDGNGVLDECEPTVNDCNSNDVHDECELVGNDCNTNGIPDDCEIAEQTSNDDNGNGIPDECESSDGDCNSNGVPDHVELQTSFSSQQIVSESADGAWSVFTADLDDDGDLDLILGLRYGDSVIWYENTDGLGGFGPAQVITTAVDEAVSVFAADLDGDGDIDVLSASQTDDKIAWYENINGLGGFGPQQVITTAAEDATSVSAADLDGDGDLDVLSSSASDDKIAWYENTDGLGGFGPQQVITTTADRALAAYSADLDGDGDLDVLSASVGDNTIAWYENTDGLGSFGFRQVITTVVTQNVQNVDIYATDLDGDGDFDVLSASADEDKIAWYENTDGVGGFGPQKIITTEANNAGSVIAADMDGDGDADVLSTSNIPSKVAWYENLIDAALGGPDGFGPQQTITLDAYGVVSIITADLDGDGDLDVVSASVGDDKIAWYENESQYDCNQNRIHDECDVAGTFSTDCNANGIPDECEMQAINASPSAIECPGTEVTLDAGAGYSSYLWEPGGETSQTIQVMTPGTYRATVTGGAGMCVESHSIGVAFGGSEQGGPAVLASSKLTNSVVAIHAETGKKIFDFAPQSANGLNDPNGITVDSVGHVYVASVNTSSVMKFAAFSGELIREYTGTLTDPVGVLVAESDTLLVSNWSDDSVHTFDIVTGQSLGQLVASGAGGLDGPADMLLTLDGTLLVSSQKGDQVLAYDAETGAFGHVAAQGGGLMDPAGLLLDPQGNLLVASFNSDQVLRFDPDTGTLIDVFVGDNPSTTGTDESGGLDGPEGLEWNANGHLLVNNRYGGGVLEYDGTTGAFIRAFGADALDQPTYLAMTSLDRDCNEDRIPDYCPDDTGVAGKDCNFNGVADKCDTTSAGDFDANGVLDIVDFGYLADCQAGPGILPSPAGGSCTEMCLQVFDADADGDVDLHDFAEFVQSH